ncbi:hypothetical protein HNY73_017122 [Argiope bruennichi]|uniref:Uncharacterized protein n=1 Tax=Argiope bruennichi TaxID=94029 RepID=A0A8T0EKV0_ARGBR|nr:hypothetical protein HNY73_017122 [Argiope bruennichi]
MGICTSASSFVVSSQRRFTRARHYNEYWMAFLASCQAWFGRCGSEEDSNCGPKKNFRRAKHVLKLCGGVRVQWRICGDVSPGHFLIEVRNDRRSREPGSTESKYLYRSKDLEIGKIRFRSPLVRSWSKDYYPAASAKQMENSLDILRGREKYLFAHILQVIGGKRHCEI